MKFDCWSINLYRSLNSMDISKSQLLRILMRISDSASVSSTTTLTMTPFISSNHALRTQVSLKEFSWNATSSHTPMTSQNTTIGKISMLLSTSMSIREFSEFVIVMNSQRNSMQMRELLLMLPSPYQMTTSHTLVLWSTTSRHLQTRLRWRTTSKSCWKEVDQTRL